MALVAGIPYSAPMVRPIILVHGGAGAAPHGESERTAAQRRGLIAAVEAARAALKRGAVAAARAAVEVLEDDPLFNAGTGSALDREGRVACSASIMDGFDGRAGSVAGLACVRHPVAVAADLLDHRHCFLIGPAGEAFARSRGHALVAPEALVTAERRAHLKRIQADGGLALDHDVHDAKGTVGAVVRDAEGRLAAATSTGGLTNQDPGRVGDTAVIGAGTWADQDVAVSCTGMGEAYIRAGFAQRVANLVSLGHLDLDAACHRALGLVGHYGGRGGCIALTEDGCWAMPFTTTGMYRAMAIGDGPVTAAIGLGEGLMAGMD